MQFNRFSNCLPREIQVVEKLQAGDPPIHVQKPGKGKLLISVWMMRGDEHQIVGRRLKEILS